MTKTQFNLSQIEETAIFDTITETPVPIDTLFDILAFRRSDGSEGELEMINKYIMPLHPYVDGFGNMLVTVPDGGTPPNIAFTAHTDTVHRDTSSRVTPSYRSRLPDLLPSLGTRQDIVYEQDGLILAKPSTQKDGQCLGADDGTGIWIMLNMISAGIPGLYCFFRDEESGRIGSEWSVSNTPEYYVDIDIMISFDRAGCTDVITHQMGSRCCSDEFAWSLSGLIATNYMTPDPTGSFTDSCSFMDTIPECTNISVGYDSQHSSYETQDLTWVSWLVTQLIAADWTTLPISRDPSQVPNSLDDSPAMINAVTTFPTAIADILEEYYGISVDNILEDLTDYYGVTRDNIVDHIEHIYLEEDADNPSNWKDWL